ncbi:hypothetical protein B0T17DRAFT_505165 [Bombardia bombarda]|uniref:Uncharacterized protein n=1 Tax=Bombardia bombarda TaxID=252184 RepID=A0AA39X7B0_9PEZI|nr:hypothetical protein B0T17DRAFT_505165 [Bombardia bombarda]
MGKDSSFGRLPGGGFHCRDCWGQQLADWASRVLRRQSIAFLLFKAVTLFRDGPTFVAVDQPLSHSQNGDSTTHQPNAYKVKKSSSGVTFDSSAAIQTSDIQIRNTLNTAAITPASQGVIPSAATLTVPTGSSGLEFTFTCDYQISAAQTITSTITAQAPGQSPTSPPISSVESPVTATITTTLTTSDSSLQGEQNSTPQTTCLGLSKGAIIGIGVGSFILGILLGWAAAAACFFFANRRRQNPESESPVHDKPESPFLPPMPPPKTSINSSGDAAASARAAIAAHDGRTISIPDAYLLPATDDAEITSELSVLGGYIRDHVQNNYHLQPVQYNAAYVSQSLAGLGLSEKDRSRITSLSADPQTRYAAIRHLLALSIFSALDIRSANSDSLLPSGVAAFLGSLPANRTKTLGSQDAPAFSAWRRLSAFLLHEKGTHHNSGSDTSQVGSLKTQLNGFLQIFAEGEDSRARLTRSQNLDGVIRECAALGYTLFSHPCEWRFVFSPEEDTAAKSTSLVVTPGLEKLSNEQGELFDSPRIVARPETVVVDSFGA